MYSPASAMHWVFSETFLVASFGAWGARHFYKFKLWQFWKVGQPLQNLVVWRFRSRFARFKFSTTGCSLTDDICQVQKINTIFVKCCSRAKMQINASFSCQSPSSERWQRQRHSWLFFVQFWIPPMRFKHFNQWPAYIKGMVELWRAQ